MSTHFDYMTPAPDATGDPGNLCNGFNLVEPAHESKHGPVFAIPPGELSGNSGKLVYASGYSRSDDVPAFDLLEAPFLTAMAEVMSEGEKRHGKDNWKRATPDEQGVTVRHLMGHLMRWLCGDRSEPHLAKVAIGAMFLHYHDKCELK